MQSEVITLAKKKRSLGPEMAARWAYLELASLLKLLDVETDEFDVSDRVSPKPDRENLKVFSYHTTPYSFWIYISQDLGSYLPISAQVNKGQERHYYSFVYDSGHNFRRIDELPEKNGRFWMTIIG